MKKLMTLALCALMTGICAASTTQYKVYDVSLSLKSTKAAGYTSCGNGCGSCSDATTYLYRKSANRKIEGVIAGCGCIAMAGDESCDNFQIYFWDATTKTQLNNFTWTTKILQRIGKKGDEVEQVVVLVIDDGAGETYELQLAGLGKYTADKSCVECDTCSVKGGVTGTADAPYKYTPGSCNACGTTPDVVEQSTAVTVCTEDACEESETGTTTPVYGTYTFKYNKKKAKKCEKDGISAKALGLPNYVAL